MPERSLTSQIPANLMLLKSCSIVGASCFTQRS